ncbi:MAG: phosphate regulon sensor histidine kinase PhoR [Gammaproteobacteria bacterium]|nr:phosphate regulon sensor histidine kinase PhoR [Gammaproteobacteria bacterium]MBT8111525.1 phosphate regulon sensor histidine kinase PhoR [Gammaproteobacteria bacterium]NND46274.1 phosphate regulon sensor histidine kinase PhoR [Woeseiaceae bacterium]NNL46223.1 phosphate regulon sensor histidine kinase PhoR [Woeseiaceae bacterium]
MSIAARKFLIGLILLLAAGAGIGWIYGHTDWGLLAAALLALIWQVRHLLSFERALRTGNFDDFRFGEGIWEQIFSRFRFERERAVRRKQNYRTLLREIRKSTNAMPDGAVILDADYEIVVCNRAAKDLAGIKRKKDRGQRIDNILRDPELSKLLRSGDHTTTIEIMSPVRDGNWLNCRVVPYGAEQKLLLLRDVTERMRLAKMRRDFVANASHELRSPLTVISGYLDALAGDDDIPETWQKPVVQMRGQAARMRQILGELLELSRLESAGPLQSDEPFDVLALLEASREALAGHANAAGITINAESAARLRGNIAEIETVIVNLLSNAIRHTPSNGEITVAWRSGEDGADLIVADTGEGIDPEYIPRLTERFFRVDRGRSRDDGGIGLGLAIVKHVLARHDAELIVTSEAGAGSEFRCHFPPERVVVTPTIPLS